MDRHFDELIKYYELIAQKRSEELLSAEENLETFERIFGDGKAALEIEWRSYMRSLKTDVNVCWKKRELPLFQPPREVPANESRLPVIEHVRSPFPKRSHDAISPDLLCGVPGGSLAALRQTA